MWGLALVFGMLMVLKKKKKKQMGLGFVVEDPWWPHGELVIFGRSTSKRKMDIEDSSPLQRCCK